jgi:two-component system, NarL family, invasion response regulator UvrY
MTGGKLLLVDDHFIVRTGLRVLLSDMYPFMEIHEATDGESTLAALESSRYKLVIMDIQMPNTESIHLLHTVSKRYPETPVLIYSMCSENIYGKRFIRAGAKGFLSKVAPLSELKKAVGQVMDNRRYVSETLLDILASDTRTEHTTNPFGSLSAREFEIVSLLLSGSSVSAISHRLSLQPSTVATHKARIFDKLSVTNIVELKDLASAYNFT